MAFIYLDARKRPLNLITNLLRQEYFIVGYTDVTTIFVLKNYRGSFY